MDDYKAIAEEILSRIREPEWDDEEGDPYWLVRFCDWKHDAEQLCVYCSKPREEQQGYLCTKCLNGTGWNDQDKLADTYDYRRIKLAPAAALSATKDSGS
ncbi:MAG TPA: hypothetical protein VFX97_16715 [Pyrinomonadaceae bacterium]|nr:hypothetical protein [Pyrinomonadaceae bacterium]